MNGSWARIEFFVAAIMKLAVFCNVTFSSAVETARLSGGKLLA
jgi:hypothetical protein